MASPRWIWDSLKNRFKDSRLGRFLSRKAMTDLRDTTAEQAAKEFRTLAEQAAKDVAAGTFDADAFTTAFKATIRNLNASQYILGRGGLSAMSGEDFRALQQLLQDQHVYADGFAADLASGAVTEAQAGARAELYAGVGGYERGQASAWGLAHALPEYPGDRCLGRNNCRCAWDLQPDDTGGIDCYWQTEANPCEVCAANAAIYNPYRIEGDNRRIGTGPVKLSLSRRAA